MCAELTVDEINQAAFEGASGVPAYGSGNAEQVLSGLRLAEHEAIAKKAYGRGMEDSEKRVEALAKEMVSNAPLDSLRLDNMGKYTCTSDLYYRAICPSCRLAFRVNAVRGVYRYLERKRVEAQVSVK